MDTRSAAPFAVLLKDRQGWDPLALAKAFAAARKTPLQDQMAAAKRSWGIIADKLAEDEARELAALLSGAGLESVVRPASSLPELPPVEPAVNALALKHAAPALIAVAAITVISTSTMTEKKGPSGAQKIVNTALMMGGLPIKLGGKAKTVQKTQQHHNLAFYADLVYPNPTRRLRVDAAKFDYSFLGPRMLYQAQANLKLLVGDLARAAPAAWLNHGARILLDAAPIQTMGYATLADLEREERWLMGLQALDG